MKDSLQNVPIFNYDSSSGVISLKFYTGTASSINLAKLNDPLVFRVPTTLMPGVSLTSIRENASAGSIASSSSQYDYYQFTSGAGWVTMQIAFDPSSSTFTSSSSSPSSSATTIATTVSTISSPGTFSSSSFATATTSWTTTTLTSTSTEVMTVNVTSTATNQFYIVVNSTSTVTNIIYVVTNQTTTA